MKKEILINATVNEVRVGITEDSKLVEFFVEHPENERIIGNIYFGKVQKIVQGMNAAFIDIGLDQDAFLHFSDVDDSLENSMYTEEDDPDDDEDEVPSKDSVAKTPLENSNTSKKKQSKKKNNRQNKTDKDGSHSPETTDNAPIVKLKENALLVVDSLEITSKETAKPITSEPTEVPIVLIENEQTATNTLKSKTQKKEKPSKKRPTSTSTLPENAENNEATTVIDGSIEVQTPIKEVIPPEVKNPAILLPNRRKIIIVGSKITEDNQFDVSIVEDVDSEQVLDQEEKIVTTPIKKTKTSRRTPKKQITLFEAEQIPESLEELKIIPITTKQPLKISLKNKTNEPVLPIEKPIIIVVDKVVVKKPTRKVQRKSTPVKLNLAEVIIDKPIIEAVTEVAPKTIPKRKTVARIPVKKAIETVEKVENIKVEKNVSTATPTIVKRTFTRTKKSALDPDTNDSNTISSDAPTTKKTTSRRKKSTVIPFAAEVADDVSLTIPLSDDGSIIIPTSKRQQRSKQTKAPAPLPTFNTKRSGQVTINLSPKQMIPVQVVRDAYSSKGVRVTTRITIPGRNVVFLPFDNVIGVSKKIHSSKERRRLRRLAVEILPKGSGCIIRTAAQGQTEDDLRRDWEELLSKWHIIEKRIEVAEKPTILYNDVNTSTKVIRDLFTENVDTVVIDSYKIYKEIHTYVQWASPQLLDKIVYYTDKRPLFDTYGIEKDIMMLPNRKVYLPSGGSIVIDPTEALVAIDVNTGRATKDRQQEQNALKTNLEALYEVARQLRLRDIGGMVIIDFIDMVYDDNRKRLYQEMVRELNKDSAKTVVYPLTQLGLMQITRQRIRQNIMAVITDDCSHCRGTGKVYSRSVVLNSLERWLRNYKTTSSAFSIHLLVHPELGELLTHGEFSMLQKLMLKYFIRIKLHFSTDLPFNEFQFVPIDQE